MIIRSRNNLQLFSLYSMVVFYFAAGLNHFWHSNFYMKLMPTYLPYHFFLVEFSGIIEISLALLLCFSSLRKTAAWLIILMLIAFLPVHIDMILKLCAAQGCPFWIAVLRFPLQFVFMGWAYKVRLFNVITT